MLIKTGKLTDKALLCIRVYPSTPNIELLDIKGLERWQFSDMSHPCLKE